MDNFEIRMPVAVAIHLSVGWLIFGLGSPPILMLVSMLLLVGYIAA